MEFLTEPKPQIQMECPALTGPIWQDVLAQAVTGELVAAMNYTALAEICDDPAEAAEALQHAAIEQKLHALHLKVMTTLAKMLAKDCKDGHCEVCVSSCVKPSLFEISLSATQLRGASLQQYLKTLDELGLPGEVTLTWVAQLPI